MDLFYLKIFSLSLSMPLPASVKKENGSIKFCFNKYCPSSSRFSRLGCEQNGGHKAQFAKGCLQAERRTTLCRR